MARATIGERLVEQNCSQCKRISVGIERHSALDAVFKQHKNGHKVSKVKRRRTTVELSEDEEEATSVRKKKAVRELTKIAKWMLTSPPYQATMETHYWQALFIKMSLENMPENDKLDPQQEVVVDNTVTRKALELAAMLNAVFPPVAGETDGEENDRPRVTGLVAGLLSLVGEPTVKAMSSPVEYYVERLIDGETEVVKCFPPGEAGRATEESLEHGYEHNKKWKMDFVMMSLIEINGEKVWVPRALVEAKGDFASFENLYQASMEGYNLQLKRLLDNKPIDRLYLEVWGTHGYYYGILDVFGYVTVEDGVVTQDSFQRYLATVRERKIHCGHNFLSDSYERCPQTINDLQNMYNDKAQKFYRKYHCELPSKHGHEDFPIGVVHLSPVVQNIPTGKLRVSMKEAGCFVQAHARILGANPSDCTDSRLLKKMEDFRSRVLTEGIDMVFKETIKRKDLPEPVIMPLDTGCEASYSVADSSRIQEDTPSKEVVQEWGVPDVAKVVSLACGNQYDTAVLNSRINGSLLMMMTENDLQEWLVSLRMDLPERLQFKKWWFRVITQNNE